ncbi:MAG TPA: hypothetical protein VFQ67_08080 [Allosphingosinicella sp.]|jgi:hypothetical protein|nr:hypothetical protein [Allosphingosinicella sp.]
MAKMLDLGRSWKALSAFLLLALIAFWPTYLSQPRSSGGFTHLHAAAATLWMLMLIAQSWAIDRRRVALHRALGKASYVLAPLLVLSVLLLAHHRIATAPPPAFPIQTYILYLQVSLAALFALSYALAIAARRSVARHSRFMICTALTLVDPVVIRILFWIAPEPSWNYQWLTFGLTDLAFLVLIALERNNRAGRGVFPAMLAVFAVAQAPAVLGLTQGAAWQAFARWVAGI